MYGWWEGRTQWTADQLHVIYKYVLKDHEGIDSEEDNNLELLGEGDEDEKHLKGAEDKEIPSCSDEWPCVCNCTSVHISDCYKSIAYYSARNYSGLFIIFTVHAKQCMQVDAGRAKAAFECLFYWYLLTTFTI